MSMAWSLYLPYPSSTWNHIWYEYPSWLPSVCVWGEWIEDVATMWFKDPHEFPDLWLPRVVGPTYTTRLLHVGQTPARGCVVVQQFPACCCSAVSSNLGTSSYYQFQFHWTDSIFYNYGANAERPLSFWTPAYSGMHSFHPWEVLVASTNSIVTEHPVFKQNGNWP